MSTFRFVVIKETVVPIDAANFNEARKEFAKRKIDGRLDTVIGSSAEMPNKDISVECVGICEGTSLPIFETDNYSTDTEGTMWLKDPLPPH